jgi:ribosomal protein S18 acetylase RimI-like enzyme
VTRFRVAGEEDVERVLALQRRYYAEDGYPFSTGEARGVLARFVTDPALGRLWWIEEAKRTAGYLALTFGYSLEYRGRDAFVDELYLLPEHRGRGLGRAAIAFAESEARALGVRAIQLEVERAKDAAKSIYRRAGFVDHDRHLMTRALYERPSDEPGR